MIYKFRPIFKSTIWGGERLAPFKGVDTDQSKIGESWELSGVKGDESVVDGGPDDGMTLPQLIDRYGATLLGQKVFERYGREFPLLIKFIDADSDLSVQVHPDDALAAERHNGSRGKTEMWYVVQSAPGARLLTGFSRPVSKEEYVRSVDDNSITDLLGAYPVNPGDVFFLPAGRVHAIGAGCFVAEIQETSDITYRIYDYDRRDKDGNPRQLHTELAKDAIDFSVEDDYRTAYDSMINTPVSLVDCEHFHTRLLDIDSSVELKVAENDSFMIVMCLEGEAIVSDHDSSLTLRQGHTLLVPASEEKVEIKPISTAKILTSHIP